MQDLEPTVLKVPAVQGEQFSDPLSLLLPAPPLACVVLLLPCVASSVGICVAKAKAALAFSPSDASRLRSALRAASASAFTRP